MPRRPTSRPRTRSLPPAESRPSAPPGRPRRRRLRWILAGLSVLVALATIGPLAWRSPSRLRAEAERASRANDRSAALHAWRAFNATGEATGATHREEARAALALGYAAQAEQSLRRAAAADTADPEPWRLLLEIFRVEDRTIEAQRIGWEAYDRVPAGSRRDILRELTLALLADLPDDLVRDTLKRWIAADPSDVDARVALAQRIAGQPRATDPDRPERLAELEELLAAHPKHLGVREALVAALADAGEPDRGRALLDAWPGPAGERDNDPRYQRLRGRWDLEYDHRPAEAAAALGAAVQAVPQDWRSWYRLARAFRQLGREAEARRAAEVVSRLREALEPSALGARLDDDFRHLDDPRSLRDLATLAAQVGLARLADAWRAEAGP